VALAALLTGRVPPRAGTLAILSGGNVDLAAYARAIAGTDRS
jgi:threonine dehydratase